MAKSLDEVYKRCRDAACRDDEVAVSNGGPALPPNRRELGRAGWLYLHSMAADFPEKATALEELKVKAWCYSFAELYPCHICKESLVETYRRFPPVTNSRRDLLMWTFNIHNQVNAELSYPHYNATFEDLLRKYRA